MSIIGNSPMWNIGDFCYKNRKSINITDKIEPMSAEYILVYDGTN